MTLAIFLIIALHTFAAWFVIEMFVNMCHRLPRRTYVLIHYSVILLTFGVIFSVFFRYFAGEVGVFAVTLITMSLVLFYELVVFRYLYSGERWFLNWSDWIVPMFLAATAVYFVGKF